jgi:phenylalanyl-tRNA synthetase beta chain
MKFSEQWLREWVNPPVSSRELTEQLTLAGFEVKSVQPVAPHFTDVVIGQVMEVTAHPNAERLRICYVNVGENELLPIVCGAPNVRQDLKVAVAQIGAILPGNIEIKKSKLRGVESCGMLCSEKELGLAETSSGIMELPDTAPIGENLRHYLQLDDNIIDIDITPNRGDCFSIIGIAREVAAINQQKMKSSTPQPAASLITEQLAINLLAPECPHYMGRVIKKVNNKIPSPRWMQERLRRSGIRPISPVVDVTNYVLMEMGQPLHAFERSAVQEGIAVRFAQENEQIVLLDDQQLILSKEDLVIVSADEPIALAGIMGGKGSSVTLETCDIFIESALFSASTLSKTARKYGIHTDSSLRFERGIDYSLQREALERATELILAIAKGEAGPIIDVGESSPRRESILLRRQRVKRVLGMNFSDEEIVATLQRLNMQVSCAGVDWEVTVPSYRQDVQTEIDLIEELARIYGYHNMASCSLSASLQFLPVPETKLNIHTIKKMLADRGYQEAITYSFVDPFVEKQLALQSEPFQLLNPISPELSTMRTNHWPGLIKAYQYNAYRQQSRVRLFEAGLCFRHEQDGLLQERRLGGLCSGDVALEQWQAPKRSVDFYDVKGDVENILKLARKTQCKFESVWHPALHPGKSAAIICDQRCIGLIGALHPSVSEKLDIQQPIYLFDLNLDSIMDVPLPTYSPISKFPAIRRDLALLVATNVPAERIKEKILDYGKGWLKNVQIFDVYQGKGIETGKKSIALSLTFQLDSRTLVDTEVNDLMQKIVIKLHQEFNAILRD